MTMYFHNTWVRQPSQVTAIHKYIYIQSLVLGLRGSKCKFDSKCCRCQGWASLVPSSLIPRPTHPVFDRLQYAKTAAVEGVVPKGLANLLRLPRGETIQGAACTKPTMDD